MVAPVSEEPEVTLVHWGIMRDPYGYRLVGYRADTLRGRITSPIVAFEGLSRTAETESGRVYHLRGPSDYPAAWLVACEHMRRAGLGPDELDLATVADVALAFAPKPAGGWH